MGKLYFILSREVCRSRRLQALKRAVTLYAVAVRCGVTLWWTDKVYDKKVQTVFKMP